ncbi:MAG: hypothetical protein ACJAT4_000210 [Granulosicoccus sp.]
MENKLTENISRTFELPLPDAATMDQQLDQIIPRVRPWGEDLYEQQYYLETRWLEIRDDDEFHESVLHIFRDEGEYMISIDGNITQGIWKILSKSNTFIIEKMVGDAVITSELYDLAFLNKDFFILRKHGDQKRKGGKKYFVLANERSVRGLEWRDVMELLYNQYRNNSTYMVSLIALVVLVLATLAYSFFF